MIEDRRFDMTFEDDFVDGGKCDFFYWDGHDEF